MIWNRDLSLSENIGNLEVGGAYCTLKIQPNDGWVNIEFDTRRGRRRQHFRRMKELNQEQGGFSFNYNQKNY